MLEINDLKAQLQEKTIANAEMLRFGNDQFAPILRYRDLVQGNVTIKRIYYVEGLNHNLFSVGQASIDSTWLWHHRLSHLNFDTINMLFKNDIVNSLTQFEDNNSDQAVDAQFDADEFINPLCTPVHEVAESFSHNIDTSNMHRFLPRQPVPTTHWTRDHPLEQVCGNPSDTDEAKNIKEAMVDHAWIEAMQEELHQFDRLSV
ncbi:integrase, catalytic region, zinc finger, CCHC-type containing protein [Tanacetum coccineum]|uniref:Integrase, catalytic region, zinc finger, CCHC-type containing protein n=1 Tax=Tanacetum coccineum TaxID=301880 RepID=A0ABQ5I649_9ASTR